jgi:glycosyltransferase involved in cell wall biosynthesis
MRENGNRKTKILHLLRSDSFSGAENVVCQIINLFRDDQVEMVYCSPDGEIIKSLQEHNITFRPLKRFCINEIRRVVKEYKPDIIHAHDISASVASALMIGNVRIISHMHVNHQNMRGMNLRTFLFLLCSMRFEHIYWVSRSAFSNYRFSKWISGKSSILYNIIDQDTIYKRVCQDPNTYDHDIIYIGRLTYQKNPQKLLRVLSMVIRDKPDTRVLIVGNGDLLEECRCLVVELGLDSNVTFLGFRDNPLKMLRDAKVMILTSRFEGTPMCALEAMALGVPVVSTPIDGLIDLVENGITGFLSDDEIEMAKLVLELISNSQKHIRFSNNSLKRFEILNNMKAYKKELKNIYFDS